MIQSFREKLSGVIATALIVLIAIPLAFFGVDSLFLNNTRLVDVGEVNGEAISELELERAVVVRRNQVAQMLGENYTPDMVSDDQLRQTAINDLIVQKIYLSAAKDLGMDASESQIGNQLLGMEQFKLGDQFSDALFRNYLAQMGYTSASFMESFAEELTVRQLTTGLLGSGFSTDVSLEQLISVSQEKRSYQYLELPVDSVLAEVEVTDDEIEEYYELNQDLFEQPEMLSVDYLRLSRDLFVGQVEVSSEEVMERFEILQASQPARREAAHILIEENDESFARLDEIQARLQAGDDFAAIAEEHSDDIGSSANGGNLGFTSGDTFPFEFEQALENLEIGEVSEPVQTEAGFHVIKLLSEEVSPLVLEDEYAALELSAKQEKAEQIYVEALEEFTEAALSTDDLSQLIEDMSSYAQLDVQSTEPFERNFGTGIAANAQVRAVAFGPIVKEDELNSEAVEISDTEAVVVHLKEHFEEGIAPLDQVRAEITENLKIEKGTDLLAAKAQELTAEITAGADLEEVARREGLEWQVKLNQERAGADRIGQQIFALALTKELPLTGNLVQLEGGYIVYQVDSVEAGSLDALSPGDKRQLRTQLGNQLAGTEFNAYTETLREGANIDIKIDVDLEI